MARKRRARKSKKATDPWDGRTLFRWVLSLADARRRAWLRRCVVAAGLVAVGVGISRGLDRVAQHVQTLRRYAVPLTFRLAAMPQWAEGIGLDAVVTSSLESFRGAPLLDPGLTAAIADRLRENVWVKQVVRVEKRFGGVVEVECTYRRPIAAISVGGQATWIDADRVRLPARPRSDRRLLWIDGVEGPAPEVGRRWAGDDVAAAIRLASLLIDEPYADQLSALMFDNYGGRVNRRQPHVKLATVYDTRIIWGAAPGEEIEEQSAAQKIAQLRLLYRQFKRVDTNRAWVNVTKGPDRIGRARPETLSATVRGM